MNPSHYTGETIQMSEKKTVALDANILLDITRLKIDFFDQIIGLVGNCSLVIPIQVEKEIEKISKEKGKSGSAARTALALIKAKKIAVIPVEAENGDEALIQLSQKGIIIVTSDKGLRQSLKKAPQGTILVRQSKYLAWA